MSKIRTMSATVLCAAGLSLAGMLAAPAVANAAPAVANTAPGLPASPRMHQAAVPTHPVPPPLRPMHPFHHDTATMAHGSGQSYTPAGR